MSKKNNHDVAGKILYFIFAVLIAVLVAFFMYEHFGEPLFNETYYYEGDEFTRKWMCLCLWNAGKYIILGGAILAAIIYGFAVAIYTDHLFLNLIVSAIVSALGGAIIPALLLFIWWAGVVIDCIGFFLILMLIIGPFVCLAGGLGGLDEVVGVIFFWIE